MSVEVSLVCDKCGARFGPEPDEWTVRNEARDQGWAHGQDGLDRCGQCRGESQNGT